MFDEDSKTRQLIRSLRKRMKSSPLLFARLGECYLQLGDWENAAKILKKGVKEHPVYTTGHLVLGEAYLFKGFYGDAEECAEKGLEKNPSHLGLLRLIEKIKRRTNEDSELEKVRESLRSLDPLATLEESIPPEVEDKWIEKEEISEVISKAEDSSPQKAALKMEDVHSEVGDTGEEGTDDSGDIDRKVTEDKTAPEKTTLAAEEKVQSEVSEAGAEGVADAFGIEGVAIEDESDSEKSTLKTEKVDSEAEKLADIRGKDQEALAAPEKEVSDLKALVEDESKTSEPESAEKPARRKKKIATRTLGELYATQKKFDEAIEIYEKLIENNPSNKSYLERLEELKNRRDAALSENLE